MTYLALAVYTVGFDNLHTGDLQLHLDLASNCSNWDVSVLIGKFKSTSYKLAVYVILHLTLHNVYAHNMYNYVIPSAHT